jgi:phosphopantothenoylcysteine decarboxylase/phosphopantothenate--cysteine ligase
MRIIVTAGPTREYIDDVRFISNASSGRMGYAVAAAGVEAGHEVTLLAGPGVAEKRGQATFSAGFENGDRHRQTAAEPVPIFEADTSAAKQSRRAGTPEPVPIFDVVRFESVDDLRAVLAERFGQCDALVMTAAVGDFRPERRVAGKIPRAGGPVMIRLVPTEDILAALTAGKRSGQVVVAFAVEALPPAGAAAKAQAEMREKGADFVVVNGPEAMDAPRSRACVLDREGEVLEWDTRSKDELAREIVRLVEKAVAGSREQQNGGTKNPEKQEGGSREKRNGGIRNPEPGKRP